MTVIDVGATYAAISANAEDNYIDNWLLTTSISPNDDNTKSSVYVKINS